MDSTIVSKKKKRPPLSAAGANRARQRQYDQRQRFLHLADSNSALDLESSVAKAWLLGPAGADLANNTLASAQLISCMDPCASRPPRKRLANHISLAWRRSPTQEFAHTCVLVCFSL